MLYTTTLKSDKQISQTNNSMKIEVQGKGLSEAFLLLVMTISVDLEPPLNMYIRRENAFAGKLFLVARARANNALNCIFFGDSLVLTQNHCTASNT